MVASVLGRFGQFVDRHLRRRDVGIAEAEVDDVLTGAARLVLQLVDLSEHIWGQIADAAELHGRSPRIPAGYPCLRERLATEDLEPPQPAKRQAERARHDAGDDVDRVDEHVENLIGSVPMFPDNLLAGCLDQVVDGI